MKNKTHIPLNLTHKIMFIYIPLEEFSIKLCNNICFLQINYKYLQGIDTGFWNSLLFSYKALKYNQ